MLGGDFGVLVNCSHVFAWFLVCSGVLIHESVSICMFVQEIIRLMEMVEGLSLESYAVSPSLWSLGAIFCLASAPVFVFSFFLLNLSCQKFACFIGPFSIPPVGISNLFFLYYLTDSFLPLSVFIFFSLLPWANVALLLIS